ncbi:MAG: FMN-binding protein [bacterium]
MKKFILSLFVIVSFGFYVFSQNNDNSTVNLLTKTTTTTSSSKKKSSNPIVTVPIISVPVENNPQNNQKPIITPIIVQPKKTGIYNDGEYVGDSVDAYYGNVQVKAIISGGKLTDIQFLDYPQDRGTSVRINSRALPILKKEAIKAQSANVNTVSGASETSPAFIKSLASALNQAKA